MAPVIVMRKRLDNAPKRVVLPGIELRTFIGAGDIPRWLELQARAMPISVSGRPWTERDFAREFLRQSWWDAARMWFAQSRGRNLETLGTATLGERGVPGRSCASIHWLLVDPDNQGQGVGRLLVAAVEETCWQAGRKTLTLETLSSWTGAVAFYEALGYEAE
jgi:GNAT superfamily N-acetyltransferase